MKKMILTLLPAIFLSVASLYVAPTFAQTATAPAMSQDSLYQAFGAKPGLVKLVDDFMVRLLADPRTGPHFKPVDQKHVKEQLVDQFCVQIGGPCEYKGADMESSHSNLDITKSDFNALVEVLQMAMDAQGIAFTDQNKLLAKLAPMYRDIITVE